VIIQIVPAQVGAAVVTQFVEFGTIGILLLLLALIINGTFRLRREVNGYKEERDYWQKRAMDLEERLDKIGR
jgi:hypothetical protein